MHNFTTWPGLLRAAQTKDHLLLAGAAQEVFELLLIEWISGRSGQPFTTTAPDLANWKPVTYGQGTIGPAGFVLWMGRRQFASFVFVATVESLRPLLVGLRRLASTPEEHRNFQPLMERVDLVQTAIETLELDRLLQL